MSVTESDIARAARGLGLEGQPVCLHSSLRSFGRVEGGPEAVVGGFLEAGCTVVVPTFTQGHAVRPRPGEQVRRNGWAEDAAEPAEPAPGQGFSPDSQAVDRDMGAVPAAVARWPGRVRGDHPLNSFAAVGPLADAVMDGQRPEAVYAPLRAVVEAGGSAVLAGVGLDRLTLLHLAEAEAGRELFRRWAAASDGRRVRAAVGSCSDGFPRLEAALAPLTRRVQVGESGWAVLPAAETVARAAAAIRADPEVTRCNDPDCPRCPDAIAGGPVLEPDAA